MNGKIMISLCGMLALASCTRSELSGPPELRSGRDECHECGMIINEDRCSSAILVDNRGRREHLLFDDVGCMLDYERGGMDGSVLIDRFVHDHGTRRWLRGGEAHFVLADPEKITTPMGTGILAYALDTDAHEAARRYAGTVMNYASLARARREWMESRYGKPDR